MAGSRDLTPVQVKMLWAEMFHVDGWCSRAGIEAAESLAADGLVERRERGCDTAQYTVWEYTVTAAGRIRRSELANPAAT